MAERGLPAGVAWRYRRYRLHDPGSPALEGTISLSHRAPEVRSIIDAYAAALSQVETRVEEDGTRLWVSGRLDDVYATVYGRIAEEERTVWTTAGGAQVELSEDSGEEPAHEWRCSGCGDLMSYEGRAEAGTTAAEHADSCTA